jgi:translation elongation factor EF-1alpha
VPAAHPLKEWYTGKTLLEILDEVQVPERINNKLVRITVSELFKSEKGFLIGDCLNAKIESGTISEKQKLLILPHNENITI